MWSRTVREVLNCPSNRRPIVQQPTHSPTQTIRHSRHGFPEHWPPCCCTMQSALACAAAEEAGRRYRRLDQESTLYRGLPYSCPFRASTGCNPLQRRAKQNVGNSLRNREKLEGIRGEATACKALQNGSSQGSGPGGRWFESTRPDHLVFNSLHIKLFRKSGR